MKYANDVTLYIYYIKEKYEFIYGEVLPIANNVFAYTTNKKCAKLFESQRDMKLFKKEIKELSHDEYNKFMNYMTENGDRYLDIHTYSFYSNNIEIRKKMAVTLTEKRRIDGRKMMLEINITKYCWYPPYIFNDEIYKALKVLMYKDISNFIGTYPNKVLRYGHEDEEINTIEDIIKINELELVIEVIGGTLKS